MKKVREWQRMGRDISESLRSQPGRVGLSMFSVMIGIIVLTLLLSMLFGLREQSRQLVRKFGANVIAIIPESGLVAVRGFRGLDDIAELMRRNLSGTHVAIMIRLNERVTNWDHAPVWAIDRKTPEVRGWSLSAGRGFDSEDEQRAARSILITDALASRHGLRPGDSCSIGHHAFIIAGIVRDGSGIPDAAGMNTITGGEPLVFMLQSTAERLEYSVDASSAAVFLRVDEARNHSVMLARAQALVNDPAWSAWRMNWVTPESLIRGIRDLQRLIALTAGSVSALCLALGGTTLMSLMLADVRQRVPEIGLRRALGGTPRDVANLFVAESCVITGVAALVGIIAARVILGLLEGRIAVPLSLEYFTFVIPVIVSIVLGGVFSFWPAQYAARLSPAQALRNA
mgnify:CR=1 FL=1